MKRGGCSLPAATPRKAPMPSFSHAARSRSVAVRPVALARAVAALAGAGGCSALAGGLGQIRRVNLVGGRIDQVPREPGGAREDLAGARALTDLARGAPVRREDDQFGHRLVVLLSLVAVERVGAEDRALHGGMGALAQ